MTTEKSSSADLDIPQLWTIASKLGDWLITILQLYFVINIAIVGWILTTKPYLDDLQKVILAAMYVLIVCVNLWWMIYLYFWLKKIFTQIEEEAGEVSFLSSGKNSPRLINVSKWWHWVPVLIVHLLSDFFVVYCILCLTSNQK